MKDKKPMSATKRKGKKPTITQQDAIEMLASAINYCQQTGLKVKAGNLDGKLALLVEGAAVDQAGSVLRFVILPVRKTEK